MGVQFSAYRKSNVCGCVLARQLAPVSAATHMVLRLTRLRQFIAKFYPPAEVRIHCEAGDVFGGLGREQSMRKRLTSLAEGDALLPDRQFARYVQMVFVWKMSAPTGIWWGGGLPLIGSKKVHCLISSFS